MRSVIAAPWGWVERLATGVVVAGMIAILVSNVLLHRSIDREAGLEWSAVTRLDDQALTASQGIQQRYGLFFSLRKVAGGQTVIEIPTRWRGSTQERQFEEFFRSALIGVSDVKSVVTRPDLPFTPLSVWSESTWAEFNEEGFILREGRSRANSRQPWYVWRIVAASERPPVLQVWASSDNEFIFFDPRISFLP